MMKRSSIVALRSMWGYLVSAKLIQLKEHAQTIQGCSASKHKTALSLTQHLPAPFSPKELPTDKRLPRLPRLPNPLHEIPRPINLSSHDQQRYNPRIYFQERRDSPASCRSPPRPSTFP